MSEGVYRGLLGAIVIGAAIAVIAVNVLGILWSMRGGARLVFQGPLSCGLGSLMMLTLSFGLFLVEQKAALAAGRPGSYGAAIFLLLVGVFSTCVAGLLVYLDTKGS